MKKATILFLYTCFMSGLFAQPAVGDSAYTHVSSDLRRDLYSNTLGNQLPLFNGRQHTLYSGTVEGIPYFRSLDWYNGSVIYNDVLYENISMRYDQVADELVVMRGPSSIIFISLFTPRVREFSFAGTRFIRLGDSTGGVTMRPGFYEQLATGKLTSYHRETKVIEERIQDHTVYKAINTHHRYYAQKNGEFYVIRDMKDLMKLVADKRSEVQSFVSKNKLRFRRNAKKTITDVTEFYNKL